MLTTIRTLAVLSLISLSARADPARILVGPDVLVSRDSDYPHVEMTIAAHPSDPRKLVAGSMVLGDGLGTVIYSSADGGATWSPDFPPGRIASEADPQVAYTPRGTALFVDLPLLQRTPEGKPYLPLSFYRSEEGGRAWQTPILLGDPSQGGHDYPVMATDPRSGRIYIGSIYRDSAGLFRSDDDGRTFTGPREMIRAAEGQETNYGTAGLAALSDGALVHFYVEYPLGQGPDIVKDCMAWVAVSRDGGDTFGKPVAVGKQVRVPRRLEQERRGHLLTAALMAVDASTGPYRDRLYIAWVDFRTGLPQAMLTWSADRGETWSEPRPVAGPLPEGAHSFQVALAVNKDGVLGLSWLDTRNHPGTENYDAYFSASLDGGETLLPPVRLSSETSNPLGAGNLHPSPGSWPDHQRTIRLSLTNALSRYPHGGDYADLAAGADGAFHPIWPDARTGTFQAWTARVAVERGPAAPKASGTASPAPPVDLKEHVELLIDPATYDVGTKELRLPVRIRNRSGQPVRGPLQVRVKTFGSGMGELFKENTPAILNAANGQTGAGAVFDYSQSLGDFDVLAPGAVTKPIVWRLKLVHARTPDLHVEITGRVE